MRSRDRASLLLRKEWRELRAARVWWLYLAACGVLVGQAFSSAVSTYAEVSGGNGGPAALAQGVSPLDGFIVPLFGVYAIAATLLLPFVAIRLMAAEKEGGGLDLILQAGVRPIALVTGKFVVALAGWSVGLLPAVAALALWRAHGGHLAASEVGVVLLGHLLRAGVTIALGISAAAWTESASTAAIVALGVTLATWALDFVAAVQGGLAQTLDAFTPESALRVFERGEIATSVIVASVVVIIVLLVAAAHGLRAQRLPRRTARLMVQVLMGAALALWGASMLHGSADLSEDRRNSFSHADERALRTIRDHVSIEVHLAPEDPRSADLERSVLHKLQRTLPSTRVCVIARGSSGLFAADSAYGQVWYAVGNRRAMSRSTTPAIVLQTLYELASVTPPTSTDDAAYPGYPLVIPAGLAPWLLYLGWPLLVLLAWWRSRRSSSPDSAHS